MKKKPKVVLGHMVFMVDKVFIDSIPVWGFGYSDLQAACSVPFKYRSLSWLIHNGWATTYYHPDFLVVTKNLDCGIDVHCPHDSFLNILMCQREGYEPASSPERNRVVACMRTSKALSYDWYHWHWRRRYSDYISNLERIQRSRASEYIDGLKEK